jgi:hypothetical protein
MFPAASGLTANGDPELIRLQCNGIRLGCMHVILQKCTLMFMRYRMHVDVVRHPAVQPCCFVQ